MTMEGLFDQGQIKELVRQCRNLNVAPLFLDHHRESGPEHPIGRLLAPLLLEAGERLDKMSDNQVGEAVEGLPGILRWYLETRDAPLGGRAKIDRIAYYALVTAIHDDYFALAELVHGSEDCLHALAKFPELREFSDRDGLFPLGKPFRPTDFGLGYRDHVIHYSQFLRRGFSSNLNFDFIGRLLAYAGAAADSRTCRIGLDLRRLMPRELYSCMYERDVWYGPRFEAARISNPTLIGAALVKRASPWPWLDDNHDRTELHWGLGGGAKTFQVEELSRPDYVHDGFVINRYVHAEFDLESGHFRHFDGAAKIYSADAYHERFQAHMPRVPSCETKIKLFRIDGKIAVEDWVELTSFFFRGNEMLIEYFDPELYERIWGHTIREYHRTHFGVSGVDEGQELSE